MSLILSAPAAKAPQTIRRPYSVWHVDDATVMVQVEDVDLARAFAKVNGVHRAGYSVAGAFMHLYSIKQSVPWVHNWMRAHQRGGDINE